MKRKTIDKTVGEGSITFTAQDELCSFFTGTPDEVEKKIIANAQAVLKHAQTNPHDEGFIAHYLGLYLLEHGNTQRNRNDYYEKVLPKLREEYSNS